MAKVLVAVDSDSRARAALPLLSTLLKSRDEVHLLHVTPTRGVVARQDMERLLESLAEPLRDTGAAVGVDVRAPAGTVAATVIAAARCLPADLVVLGSHGRGRVGAALTGSISHAIVAGLDCRVLVAHADPSAPPSGRLRKIMLAVAGEGDSGAAVETVSELARRFGAAVTVFHARPVQHYAESVSIERREDAWWAVGRARLRLKLDGVDAHGLVGVAWSSVPAAIAAAADGEEADLIVLDSRRLSDWHAMVVRSTTHGLLTLTGRPILLAERTVKVREAKTEAALGRAEALLPV